MNDYSFLILKKPTRSPSGVPLLSVVRNESGMLPHFLSHYRSLGIREFWFLDDNSVDGTPDLIAGQPDCGLLKADKKFGDIVAGERFGILARTLIAQYLLADRWVVSVDADEFLLLPSAFHNIDALVASLSANQLSAARAVMIDFFPTTLDSIVGASADTDPFTLCPFFDDIGDLNWPDKVLEPQIGSSHHSVRPRLLTKLISVDPSAKEALSGYLYASCHKIPLLHWTKGVRMLPTGHHANVPPSDKVQLVLAHFKFTPAFPDRISDALATKAYWNSSIEYRFLDMATKLLSNWPLAGERTFRYTSSVDLEKCGLLFSHLP